MSNLFKTNSALNSCTDFKIIDVLICGYYGADNLGDEILLKILLQELPENIRPWVISHKKDIPLNLESTHRIVRRSSLIDLLKAFHHPVEGCAYVIYICLFVRWKYPKHWNRFLEGVSAPSSSKGLLE